MEILMDGLRVLRFKKNSPTVGTSHGGLRDFGSELTKNTPSPPELELLMEELET